MFHREILDFCEACWRESSCICSHYMLCFTSFYAMLSLGNFKVPLALMVKKKWIVRFEGLLEFKWSDLGEQDVVGKGLFVAERSVYYSCTIKTQWNRTHSVSGKARIFAKVNFRSARNNKLKNIFGARKSVSWNSKNERKIWMTSLWRCAK